MKHGCTIIHQRSSSRQKSGWDQVKLHQRKQQRFHLREKSSLCCSGLSVVYYSSSIYHKAITDYFRFSNLKEMMRSRLKQIAFYCELGHRCMRCIENAKCNELKCKVTALKDFKKKLFLSGQVQLYGVCSVSQPVLIIQEYMSKGSLLDYLNSKEGNTLYIDDLIYIAFQVASGMAYLESNNFIHRDLAARNVLLGDNNVAKICDFGLARIISDKEYSARAGGKFPIKWTAPEAIMLGKFSTKSDVWSYGIFLMELFTYGESPYKGMPMQVVVELVINGGYRMPKPENHPIPNMIYNLMRNCWHQNPEDRPSFEKLESIFEKMELDVTKQSVCHRNNVNGIWYEDHLLPL